jgi:hypothetical protein
MPLDAEILQELFVADQPTKTPRNEIDIRLYREVNVTLPPRAYHRIKPNKIVLDNKPLPFHGPRNTLAAILLAILALAAYAFVRWYVDTVIELDITATKASVKRTQSLKELAEPAIKHKRKLKNNMGANMPIDTPAATARVTAPTTKQLGNIVVGVTEARLIIDDVGKEILSITLRITNLSPKSITFVSWSDPSKKAILTDQYHNYYNRIVCRNPVNQVITSDYTIIDTIQFEKPLPAAMLALDLLMENQKFEFSMVPSFIQQRMITPQTPNSQPQKATPPPPILEQPYSAERDPQLIADVKAAYDETMRRVEARARGMTSNNAIRFRKTEKEKIVKDLATKMAMTIDQIRYMLAQP